MSTRTLRIASGSVGNSAIGTWVASEFSQVALAVEPTTTVAELKRQALSEALKRRSVPPDDYLVKFRGGLVQDESVTLRDLAAGPNAPFIVLPARRQPVR